MGAKPPVGSPVVAETALLLGQIDFDGLRRWFCNRFTRL